MKFAPPGTPNVLFSLWGTRVKDFKAFVDAGGHRAEEGMWSLSSKAREGTNGKGGNDFCQQAGHTWKDPGFKQGPDHCVVGVNWHDAKAFCAWLTKTEREARRLGPDQECRLPTDAEWGRSVGSAKCPWGDGWPPPKGAENYAGSEARDENWPSVFGIIEGISDGWPRMSLVGTFRANSYELYDMGGNVCQWCEGWYRKEMNTAEVRKKIPTLENDRGGQTCRVLRGGSWCDADPARLTSALR